MWGRLATCGTLSKRPCSGSNANLRPLAPAHQPYHAPNLVSLPPNVKLKPTLIMDSRRKFIGTVATGLATTLASPRGILGANERLRLGIIGIGDRGTEIVRQAMACPDVDFVAFADIYTRRLDN